MKTIKIIHKGIERKLQYKVFFHSSEYGENDWTVFYEGTKTVTKRKFWLFGELITSEEPKEIFQFNFDVETKHQTKLELSTRLHRELELLERESEIAKGELI